MRLSGFVRGLHVTGVAQTRFRGSHDQHHEHRKTLCTTKKKDQKVRKEESNMDEGRESMMSWTSAGERALGIVIF